MQEDITSAVLERLGYRDLRALEPTCVGDDLVRTI